MEAGTMIFIPGFIKTDSSIQKLMARYTEGQHADRISLLSFFKIRKVY
jgi:hypothetical protein